MKLVSIIALCLLVGCTSRPTLEELEAEALITGDWTEVENRERMNERMRVQTEPRCFAGFVLVCHKKAAHEHCDCIPTSDRSTTH